MANKKEPFNIAIIDPSPQRLRTLKEITAPDIWDTSTGELHPEGLYSTQAFGVQGTRERNRTHAYISTKLKVFNPKLLRELLKLKSLYREILEGKGYAIFSSEENDFVRSNALEGETGFAFFVENLPKLKLKKNKSIKRNDIIDLVEKYKDLMLMDKLIVLPAGLRELETTSGGRPVEHELTKLYRKVLTSANTVSDNMAGKEDPLLDSTRWNIQRGVLEVYEYLQNLVSGKQGFIRSRWSKRRILGSTRNTISAMDTSGSHLNDPRLPEITTTQVGLHQYLKASLPLISYVLRSGLAKEIVENPNGEISVIDKKTLGIVKAKLSQTARDDWSTDDGFEGLINDFDYRELRHRPVEIDDYYFALIYRDSSNFRVFKNIEELPPEFDRNLVKPITWSELFYYVAAPTVERVKGFVTRYPLADLGSIYACDLYLKTTIDSESLYEYSEAWTTTDAHFLEMPVMPKEHIDTLVVHTVNLPNLGADFDGDQVNLQTVWSDEAVAEVNRILSSPEAFLHPSGGLVYSTGDDLTTLIFNNFY